MQIRCYNNKQVMMNDDFDSDQSPVPTAKYKFDHKPKACVKSLKLAHCTFVVVTKALKICCN